MLEKIKDIRNAVENRNYLSALALALTLPDICSQVEYGDSGRNNYIKWFDNHVDADYFQFPNFEDVTFYGKVCYALRCQVLHSGNTNVDQTVRNPIDINEFQLTIPETTGEKYGFKYGHVTDENGNLKKVAYISIEYLCESICSVVEDFYNNWQNKSDFDKYSINLKNKI